MASTDLTKKLLSRFDRLAGQRQNWETHWQEVADYMLPRKADITRRRSRGDKRMSESTQTKYKKRNPKEFPVGYKLGKQSILGS